MKYVRCDDCFDIITLRIPESGKEGEWFACSCGETCGRMVDRIRAEHVNGTPLILVDKEYQYAQHLAKVVPRGRYFKVIIPNPKDREFKRIPDVE